MSETIGNATAMREALVLCLRIIGENGIRGNVFIDDIREAHRAITAALSAPPRNCDRPECATSKSAQDVWRKEDGGKTPYYKWLLAPATKKGEGDAN